MRLTDTQIVKSLTSIPTQNAIIVDGHVHLCMRNDETFEDVLNKIRDAEELTTLESSRLHTPFYRINEVHDWMHFDLSFELFGKPAEMDTPTFVSIAELMDYENNRSSLCGKLNIANRSGLKHMNLKCGVYIPSDPKKWSTSIEGIMCAFMDYKSAFQKEHNLFTTRPSKLYYFDEFDKKKNDDYCKSLNFLHEQTLRCQKHLQKLLLFYVKRHPQICYNGFFDDNQQAGNIIWELIVWDFINSDYEIDRAKHNKNQ